MTDKKEKEAVVEEKPVETVEESEEFEDDEGLENEDGDDNDKPLKEDKRKSFKVHVRTGRKVKTKTGHARPKAKVLIVKALTEKEALFKTRNSFKAFEVPNGYTKPEPKGK